MELKLSDISTFEVHLLKKCLSKDVTFIFKDTAEYLCYEALRRKKFVSRVCRDRKIYDYRITAKAKELLLRNDFD